MKIKIILDTSKILPNPEVDIDNNPIQNQYIFCSSKHPETIKEIIKCLEDEC